MQKSQRQSRHSASSVVAASILADADNVASSRDDARVRSLQSTVSGQQIPRLYPTSDDDPRLHSTRQSSPHVADRRFYLGVKRIFDLVVGIPLLIISSPIIVIAAVAIRLESKGSPIFIQTRLGKQGRPFKMVKLRGMYCDSRTRFAHLYDYSTKENLDFCFHNEVDPRVTPVGKFFRRTSIDELPNLWNVVTGDMSLVGPRPEIPEVMALYGAYREEYLSVKPGVTCFSKCTGRDKLTKRETIEFDLDYARRRSFRLDLLILWRTFSNVILRRDVF